MANVYKPGRYRGRVENQRFVESRKGTPGFCLTVRLQSNLDDPSAEVKPYLRDVTMWLTPATVSWRMSDLHRLGYEGEDLNDLNPANPGFYSFVGKEVELLCTHSDTTGAWGEPAERWDLAPLSRPNQANRTKLAELSLLVKRGRSDVIDDSDTPRGM